MLVTTIAEEIILVSDDLVMLSRFGSILKTQCAQLRRSAEAAIHFCLMPTAYILS